MARVLIVGPATEAERLARELRERGFATGTAENPEVGCQRLEERPCDLLLLDANAFPPSDAAAAKLVALARERKGMVLALLGAQGGEEAGQDTAFDDVAFKPVSIPEVVARLQRLARRQGSAGKQVVRAGDLAIDTEKYEVRVSGRPVDLTYREYQLLLFLATHPERVFSREALLDQVWGYDYFGGTRTVDVHVRRLRSKLEDANHQFIETLRNVGYRFREKGARGQQ